MINFLQHRSSSLVSIVLVTVLVALGSTGNLVRAGDEGDEGEAASSAKISAPPTYTGLTIGGLSLFFYDASTTAETIQWSGAGSRFEISDDLMVRDAIQVGIVDSADPVYNSFGSKGATSGQLTTASDVFIDDDLELGGTLYLNRSLYMENSATPVDGDQNIYFADDGSRTNEHLRWDDSEDRFELTNGLHVTGNLVVGVEETADISYYNRFSSDAAAGPIWSGNFYDAGSVFVEDNLEFGESLFIADRNEDQLVARLYGDYAVPTESSAVLFGELDGTSIWIRTRGPSVIFAADTDNDTASTSVFDWRNDGAYSDDRVMELTSGGNLRIGGALSEGYSFDVAEAFIAGEALEPGDLVRVSSSSPPTVVRTAGALDPAVLGVISTKPGVILGGGAFSETGLAEAWGEEVAQRFRDEKEELVASALEADPDLASRLAAAEREVERQLATKRTMSDAIPAGETERRAALRERVATLRSAVEGAALDLFFERRFVPVALAGRVPVSVEATEAAIVPGDLLAPGPTPGVAVKATKAGPIVGTALEGHSGGRAKVLTLVHRGWYTPAGEATTTASPTQSPPESPTPVAQHAPPHDATEHPIGESRAGGAPDAAQASCTGAVDGRVRINPDGNLHAAYVAVSEPVTVGDILVVDPDSPGRMRLAYRSTDAAVVGIVTREPGILLEGEITAMERGAPELADELATATRLGDTQGAAAVRSEIEARFEADHASIALAGIVDARVDASYGAIGVGDLLTTSPTLGHAMRAIDPQPGTIVAKALEPLEFGTGSIKVLVMAR
jgi:hypothetical protein